MPKCRNKFKCRINSNKSVIWISEPWVCICLGVGCWVYCSEREVGIQDPAVWCGQGVEYFYNRKLLEWLDMKYSIIAVVVLALLGFYLGEGVNEDWFSQYGIEKDMMAEVPEESLAEEGNGEGG